MPLYHILYYSKQIHYEHTKSTTSSNATDKSLFKHLIIASSRPIIRNFRNQEVRPLTSPNYQKTLQLHILAGSKTRACKLLILPGVRRRTKHDNVVGVDTRVGTGGIIVRVAIRAWASVFEKLGINRRTTRVRRGVSLTATESRITESLARAPARDSHSSTHSRQNL